MGIDRMGYDPSANAKVNNGRKYESREMRRYVSDTIVKEGGSITEDGKLAPTSEQIDEMKTEGERFRASEEVNGFIIRVEPGIGKQSRLSVEQIGKTDWGGFDVNILGSDKTAKKYFEQAKDIASRISSETNPLDAHRLPAQILTSTWASLYRPKETGEYRRSFPEGSPSQRMAFEEEKKRQDAA